MISSQDFKRTYGQRCALAKALDVVGERWTMLIVRNLLVGPQRFSELLDGLPGITTNLLAKRLKEMAARGLVERTEARGMKLYALTDLGRALEPALTALADWGDVIVLPRSPDDVLDLRWGVLSLKRRYRGGYRGVVQIELTSPAPQKRFWARADGSALEVTDQPGWEPSLTVSSSDEETLLRVLMAGAPWKPAVDAGVLRITGKRTEWAAFLKSIAR